MSSITRDEAHTLLARKDAIELELREKILVLKTAGVTMDTPLVDPEGFPRSDVDVWAIRLARVRIVELRNDLSHLVDDIQKALEVIYDPSRQESDSNETSVGSEALPRVLVPFAKANDVSPGSPAYESGLKTGDLVVKFGHLDKNSFQDGSLQPLATLVAENENVPISLRVIRSGSNLVLTLTPRKNWGGRGMLGCHIVSYNSSES